jgi:two-component system, cell cycle sensor histidine kinase and response regulator CckA
MATVGKCDALAVEAPSAYGGALFHDHTAAILIIDPCDGRIVDANPAAVAFYGWSRDELRTMRAQDINTMPPEQILEEMKKARDLRRVHFEFRHRNADGRTRNVEVFSSRLDVDGKELLHSIIHDVSDRKLAESLVEMLKRSIDCLPEGAYWFDPDGRFTYVNEAGCQVLGYTKDEMLDMTVGQVNAKASPEAMAKVWEILRQRGSFVVESTHRRKDGSEIPVEIRSSLVRFEGKEFCCGFAVDITQRKQVESQLLRTEKLDALGLLAGGIAHDLNNLLVGLFGNIDMADASTNDPSVKAHLARASGVIDRVRGLTQQLLTFAKGGVPIKKVGPLVTFIEETVRFALSGSSVSCRFDIQPDLWFCDFDRNQIGQVIDNVVINAKQAMPGGGSLKVAASNVVLGDHAILHQGNYVRLTIEDSGTGMSPELLRRIFDPFFTTKANGQGLGLATSYSIVKHHGGIIDVLSRPGAGSTFQIVLPAVPDAAATAASAARRQAQGRGDVLVMDDEQLVRDVFVGMLKGLGYRPIATSNVDDAVAAFRKDYEGQRRIVAAIVDLTILGGGGGREALTKIRQIDKDMPVLVSSGYAEDPVMVKPGSFGFTAQLCKPFTMAELAEVLGTSVKPRASSFAEKALG